MSYLLKRVLIFIIGLAVIIITLLYFLQPNPIEPKNNETTKVEIDETLISQINLGKSLYVTHCASCHGEIVPDLGPTIKENESKLSSAFKIFFKLFKSKFLFWEATI